MTPTTATGTISVSEEYRNLVDKSFSKFSRLRELPPYGRSKWDAYFHKAFQVYSKLWKYQQENRHKLVETGLKRWEIGEIASRIGQLYYNYYLRTSDAKFLSESYIFYEAIMSREYFKDTGRDPSLANKHLRFYARFIVVCLLLNRREMVHQLIRQIRVLVDDYGHIFQASDTKEWKIVVQEIMRFMKADVACESSRPLRYSVLLDPHPAVLSEVVSPEVGKTLRLQDAILASYYHNEVKFNELTLDTFRMLQSMEWEPAGMLYRTRSSDATSNASSAGPAAINKSSLHLQIPDPSLPANPHKYILYRPTVSSLLLVLATACEELSSDGILLLYISASGVPFQGSQTGSVSASSGSEANLDSPTEVAKRSNSVDSTRADTFPNRDGSMLGRSRSSSRDNLGNQSAVDADLFATSGGLLLGNKRNTGANYLYPSDLLPFTRRPLIIIIDSENSAAFEVISGRERGDPAALLLSPVLQPVDEKGSSAAASSGQSSGNLFTFFLTAPSLALCRMVGVSAPNLQTGIYDQIEKTVSTLAIQVGSLLSASSSIEPTWGQILGDPFLRQLIFRFVLCRAIYSLHSLYRSREEYIPRCLPILPDEASPTSKVLETGVFQLASKLGVADQFVFSPSTLDPTRSNGELKWNAKSPARRSNHVREQNTSHFERSDASVLGGSAGRTMVGGR